MHVVDDPDIWCAADLLVKRHGSDAANVSAQLADEWLYRGDVEGNAVWRRPPNENPGRLFATVNKPLIAVSAD